MNQAAIAQLQSDMSEVNPMSEPTTTPKRKKTAAKSPTKAAPKTKAKETPAPDASEGATVTLRQLTEECGVSASVARRMLRTHGIEKPGKSWRWPADSEDLEEIRGLLTEAAA